MPGDDKPLPAPPMFRQPSPFELDGAGPSNYDAERDAPPQYSEQAAAVEHILNDATAATGTRL